MSHGLDWNVPKPFNLLHPPLRRAKQYGRGNLPEGEDDLLLLDLAQELIGEEDLGILDPDPNDGYLDGLRLPRRVEVGQPQPPAAPSSAIRIPSDRLAQPVDKAIKPVHRLWTVCRR